LVVHYKIFILIFCIIFLIGNVSAMEWDNKLSYSNKDLKVELKNWFGLGTNYGSAELKSHPSVDYVKKVGVGKQVVMYYDFNFIELYKEGLGDVKFIDEKTGKEIERDYKFVYWGEEEYESPVYSEQKVWNESINDYSMKKVKTGTETKTRKRWLTYDSRDIPKGNIRIGIEVQVKKNDYVDGVWEVGGKRIEKHANWKATMDAGLLAYYEFEQGVGAVIDSTGNGYDAINNGAERGQVGIVGNAFNYSAQNTDWVNSSDLDTEFDATSFSVNVWFKRTFPTIPTCPLSAPLLIASYPFPVESITAPTPCSNS